MIIPTFGRPRQVVACVRRLALQTLGASEVLVGIDGGVGSPVEAAETEAALRAVWPADRADRLVIERCEKVGLAAVRNTMLSRARGRVMLSLNDDVLPEPDLLERHAEAHREAGSRPVVVVGRSPWLVRAPDRLFDRLIRETSMVFFYDQMEARLEEVGPGHDWGFRHCWGLNFSAPLGLVREVGGFAVYPATYGYEDNEMAFRLGQRFGTPVLYRPGAVATHDHRMEPEGYLEREHKLGSAAWGFAHDSPECARAMFGRDVTDAAELSYSREFVERERGMAERIRTTFCELAHLPSDAVPGREHPAGASMIAALYQQHLLLKRWEWRRGLVEAAGGGAG